MILEGLHEKEIFNNKLPLRIATNSEENFDYPDHWHNAVEIVYVVENNASVNVNNIEYTLNEKDILIVGAGDIHSFHIHNSKGFRVFIQFDFSSLYTINGVSISKIYQFETKMISSKEHKSVHTKLERQINEIINEYNNQNFAYDLFFNARLLDITVLLARNFGENPSINAGVNKAYELTKIEKVFQYIADNYKNEITLSDVSNYVGFSDAHFSRAFKKATEKNFHSYLSEFRIKQAEKLLFDQNLSITQLASSTGFNSIVTFNRCFKKVKGCSPTEYINKRV